MMILDEVFEKLTGEGVNCVRVDGRVEIPLGNMLPKSSETGDVCDQRLTGLVSAESRLVLTSSEAAEGGVLFALTAKPEKVDPVMLKLVSLCADKSVTENADGEIVVSIGFRSDGLVEAIDASTIVLLVRDLTCTLCCAATNIFDTLD